MGVQFRRNHLLRRAIRYAGGGCAGVAALLGAALGVVPGVRAQSEPVAKERDEESNNIVTSISISSGAVLQPDYVGSDDYEVAFDPRIQAQFNGIPIFGDGAADVPLLGVSDIIIGPSFRITPNREESDNAALVGLGDIDRALEVGGFVSMVLWDRAALSVKLRRGIVGGHKGLVMEGSAAVQILDRKWGRATLIGHVDVMGADFADRYFTINSSQAAESGYQTFQSRGGLRNYGASVVFAFPVKEKWSIDAHVRYDRLASNAADSPIVAVAGDPDQFRFGLHLTRYFNDVF
jgi:outer membrane scaffolding protein for murein synthesis (MipA/OmpV family)